MKQRHKVARQHRAEKLAEKRNEAKQHINQPIEDQSSSTTSILGMLLVKRVQNVFSAASQAPAALCTAAVIASQSVGVAAQDWGTNIAAAMAGGNNTSTTGATSSGSMVGPVIIATVGTVATIGGVVACCVMANSRKTEEEDSLLPTNRL